GGVGSALVAAGIAEGTAIRRDRARRESRREAVALVENWLRLWSRSDWPAMRRLVDTPPASFVRTYSEASATLGIQQARYRHGVVRFEGDDPGATFTAQLQLEGFGPYRYEGRLPIRRRDGTWRVRWSPAVLHPRLTGGRRFDRARRFAPRAGLLDATGAPLDGRDPDLSTIMGTIGKATPQQAALVAIDAPSGEGRAVVSRPAGGFPRAIQGRYPPGSTFKIVTSTAALASGESPDASVSCPPEVVVGGRRFVNAEGEAFGPIPFRTAFYRSCNTAFINVASGLPAGALSAAAATFGFGGYDLPVPAFTGRFPPPKDAVERAASAIGQARVEASPLHMASVAAAVSSGTWKAPRLVRSAPPGPEKPVPVAPTLRELMRLVVTSGTGTAANVAGAPVFG